MPYHPTLTMTRPPRPSHWFPTDPSELDDEDETDPVQPNIPEPHQDRIKNMVLRLKLRRDPS